MPAILRGCRRSPIETMLSVNCPRPACLTDPGAVSATSQFASMSVSHLLRCWFPLCLAGVIALPAWGQNPLVKEQIGYERLRAELGDDLPTGATVHVALVEANTDNNIDNSTQRPADGLFNFLPDFEKNPQLNGGDRQFHVISSDGDRSGHANLVASLFFGSISSIAPDVTNIDVYRTEAWIGLDYLVSVEDTTASFTNARVFNHSWVLPGLPFELSRVDDSVHRDDVVHVVGVNNVNNGGVRPLLASAYNVISVGLSSGNHEPGTVGVGSFQSFDGLYRGPVRVKPDLVVPEIFTSYAAPFVSGAATILIEAGHNHPEWSHGSREVTGANGETYVVQHAETAEVIKSALMAGASRNLDGYAATTANGLDARFGAGQLDVRQSYRILAGGEYDSREEGESRLLGLHGFDYDPEFASKDESTYAFATGVYPETLAAALAWNVQVDIAADEANLANFDLELLAETADGMVLVTDSRGQNDNTEHVWEPVLEPETNYLLRVFRDDDFAPWDVALSWRRERLGVIAGDVDMDGDVDLKDFQILKTNFDVGTTRESGDLNEDYAVGLADFSILKENFRNLAVSLEMRGGLGIQAASVPEPDGLFLAALAAGAGWFTARRRPFHSRHASRKLKS